METLDGQTFLGKNDFNKTRTSGLFVPYLNVRLSGFNKLMSRRDDLHFSLRHALEKDGWIITDDPLILVLEKTLLKADLGAEKFFTAEKEGRKIAVEVKDFDAVSVISELKKQSGNFSFINGHWRNRNPIASCF